MFDGLQIFGKTDAKFSMTTSLQSFGSSNGRPVLNSNYQFDNQSSVLPPPGPSRETNSLPGSIHEEEELPPDSYPLEPRSLDPRQLSPRINGPSPNRPRSSSGSKQSSMQMLTSVASGLPKTWARNNNSAPPGTKTTQDDLAPLQKVSFRASTSAAPIKPQDEPPTLPSFSPEPELEQQSNKTLFFFERASSEIEKFENDLNSLKSAHERDSSEIFDEMKLCEDSIRINSLLSIQKLLKYEKSATLVDDLQSKIKTAIDANLYDDADRLQTSLDDVMKEVQQSQLLQFQPPRQLDSTESKLKNLNSNRKSHVESLKNFCVSLDEQTTRFKSITKKIEVQCSSKIDKQRQELDSAQNALSCRQKHLTIDQDYLKQKETNLVNELKVSTDDHNLQVCWT